MAKCKKVILEIIAQRASAESRIKELEGALATAVERIGSLKGRVERAERWVGLFSSRVKQFEDARIRVQHPQDAMTATECASFHGVSLRTWGRWMKTPGAPRPWIAADGTKKWDLCDVETMLATE